MTTVCERGRKKKKKKLRRSVNSAGSTPMHATDIEKKRQNLHLPMSLPIRIRVAQPTSRWSGERHPIQTTSFQRVSAPNHYRLSISFRQTEKTKARPATIICFQAVHKGVDDAATVGFHHYRIVTYTGITIHKRARKGKPIRHGPSRNRKKRKGAQTLGSTKVPPISSRLLLSLLSPYHCRLDALSR